MPPKRSGRQVAKAAKGPLDFEDLAGLLSLAATSAPPPPQPAAGDVEGEDAEEEQVPASSTGEAGALRDHVMRLAPSAHEDLWKRVLEVAGEYLKGDAPPPASAGAGAEGQEDGAAEHDETHARALQAVAFLLATFADAALDASRDPMLPPTFAEVLSLAQELLLSIPDGATQALIARALERVCTAPFENREDYYGGCLMYLIGKCLTPKTTGADVTRLHRVRHLLAELDWEHESIESLKLQLMRCVASPTFMRSTHGPELVALCFTVHPAFTAEVHGTVKNQVMYSRPNILKGYATSLYKAWKTSEGGARVQVEHCVQDWVLLAIRTAKKSAEKARSMLEEIHRHRHDDRLNDILCRLYGPVLWRSLKVANWQVRENSARLLQYTFPLIPNDLGVAEKEQELTRQLRLLRETLEDPAEPVRRVGISAVCITLKNYWDLMPPSETAELLTSLMNRCAKDKRAPMVRAAVAQGFGWILQNPMSHPTMAAVLPQIADLLNDKSPLVRAAFIELLMVVSTCHGVSVGNIASTEQLLLRLASEHTEGQAERLQKGLAAKKVASAAEAKASPDLVAKQLAKLIAPSLFNQDLVQQVARCHYFMQNAPLALLALLTHVQDIIPIPDRVKLAAALFKYGLREAEKASNAGAAAMPQPAMVATMLRVVGVLLEGAIAEPPKQKRGKKAVGAPGTLPKELDSFVYEHIREEDFLHLLKASHEESSAVAAQLREDLLFALSPLDPERLPRAADLVQHELELACRGGGPDGAYPRNLPQLTALMRTAVRWGRLGGAMEAAWERLLASAARLGRRQNAAEDLAGAVTVVEAAFRDPDVRAATVAAESGQLKQVLEAFTKSFSNALAKGFLEARSAKAGAEVRLLGPGADRWPRVLGVVVREALHLEHRAMQQKDLGVEGAKPACAQNFSGFSSLILGQLAGALTSTQATQALEALEVAAASVSSAPPTRKRAKSSAGPAAGTVPVPIDVDCVLRAQERVLEALNAASFLSVLRSDGARAAAARAAAEGEAGATSKDASVPVEGGSSGTAHMLLARALEASLWRWAAVADALKPRDMQAGTRVAQAWSFSGRMIQQMACAEAPTYDVVSSARVLFGRVSPAEDGATLVPRDEELRKVLQGLFSRLEFEPQFVAVVASVVGGTEAQKEPSSDFSPRLARFVEELIPSFRNLRAKLRPQVPAQPDPDAGGDRRRILASPTPQKLPRPAVDVGAGRPEHPTESAGEDSEADERASIGRRSFSASARSRSPPPRSESGSLFHAVFNEMSFAPSIVESSGNERD